MNHDRRNPAIFTEMSSVLHLSEEHKGKPGFARDLKDEGDGRGDG